MEGRGQLNTNIALLKLKEEEAICWSNEQYEQASSLNEAILVLLKAIPEEALTLEDRWEIQEAHYRLGMCYKNQNKNNRSIKEYKRAISQLLILKENNDYLTKCLIPLAKCYNNIGNVKGSKSANEAALNAYEQGLSHLVEVKNISNEHHEMLANFYSGIACACQPEIKKIEYFLLAIKTRKIILDRDQTEDLLEEQFADHEKLASIFAKKHDHLPCLNHNIAAINCALKMSKTTFDFERIEWIYSSLQQLYTYPNKNSERPEFILFRFAKRMFSPNSPVHYSEFKKLQFFISSHLNMQANIHTVIAWFQFLTLLRDSCRLDNFPNERFKSDMQNNNYFNEFKEFADKISPPQQKLVDIITNKESFTLSIAQTLHVMSGQISALESKVDELEEAQKRFKRKHDEMTHEEQEEKSTHVVSVKPHSLFKHRKITEFFDIEDKQHTFTSVTSASL